MAPKRERKTLGDSFPEGLFGWERIKIQAGGIRRVVRTRRTTPLWTALNLGGNCHSQDIREEMALILPGVSSHV